MAHTRWHRFDWNQYFGKNGHSFIDAHKAEADSFLAKFQTYAKDHLTGDEADNPNDVSEQKARTKLSKHKPDLTFHRNSAGEPLLPPECLDVKLEEKKHIFRCFLKSQYGKFPAVNMGTCSNSEWLGRAKDAPYPGSRCCPPWAKLSESPDRFFSTDDIPEVDYDGGRKKVILQDPSRMKNHELNACLGLWQERQRENMPSFRFHHWWSEGQKEYLQASETKPADSDAEDVDDTGTVAMEIKKGKRKSKHNDKKKMQKHKPVDRSQTMMTHEQSHSNKNGRNQKDSVGPRSESKEETTLVRVDLAQLM